MLSMHDHLAYHQLYAASSTQTSKIPLGPRRAPQKSCRHFSKTQGDKRHLLCVQKPKKLVKKSRSECVWATSHEQKERKRKTIDPRSEEDASVSPMLFSESYVSRRNHFPGTWAPMLCRVARSTSSVGLTVRNVWVFLPCSPRRQRAYFQGHHSNIALKKKIRTVPESRKVLLSAPKLFVPTWFTK